MVSKINLYKFSLILSICVPLLVVYSVEHLGYKGLAILLKPSYFDAPFEEKEYYPKYFHLQRMPVLRLIVWSILPLWGVSIYLLSRNKTIQYFCLWKEDLNQIIRQYKKAWISTPQSYKWILAGSMCWLLIVKFYFFLTIPENGDASWSFKGFVEQGFWVIATYYPDTNNHIFYNFLCLPLTWILPGQSLWVMTLPNIVLGTAMLFWLFCELSRRWNYTVALISVVYIASFYESSRYLFQGRGHLPIVFFGLIATCILLSGKLDNIKRIYFPTFILCCILGLYTVPTYVLHLFALYTFGCGYSLIYKNAKLLWHLFIAGIWICLGTLFCYLPVIGISGIESLIHTGPAHPMPSGMFRRLYPVFTAEWTEYMLGIFLLFKRAYLVAIPVGLLFGITLFRANLNTFTRTWLCFVAISVIVFFAFSWIAQILPEYRVFTFFIWHLYIAFVLIAMYWIPKIDHLPILLGVVILLLVTGTLLYTRAEHMRALHPIHNDLAF